MKLIGIKYYNRLFDWKDEGFSTVSWKIRSVMLILNLKSEKILIAASKITHIGFSRIAWATVTTSEYTTFS